MYEARRLDAVASRLRSYQEQLAALSTALDSLRDLTDALTKEMADDAAAIGSIAMATEADVGECDAAFDIDPALKPEVVAPSIEAAADRDAISPDPIIPQAQPTAFTTEIALDRLASTQIALALADEPLQTADEVAITPATSLQETTAGIDQSASGSTAATPPASRPRVVDFASRVQSAKATPFRRKAAGAVASVLLMISATIGVHGLLQSDIGQRVLELGICDAEVVADGRQCNMFGWLLL